MTNVACVDNPAEDARQSHEGHDGSQHHWCVNNSWTVFSRWYPTKHRVRGSRAAEQALWLVASCRFALAAFYSAASSDRQDQARAGWLAERKGAGLVLD